MDDLSAAIEPYGIPGGFVVVIHNNGRHPVSVRDVTPGDVDAFDPQHSEMNTRLKSTFGWFGKSMRVDCGRSLLRYFNIIEVWHADEPGDYSIALNYDSRPSTSTSHSDRHLVEEVQLYAGEPLTFQITEDDIAGVSVGKYPKGPSINRYLRKKWWQFWIIDPMRLYSARK